jgi:hypothetical protein
MNILNIPAATGPDAGVTRGIDGGVFSIQVGCDVIINPQTKKKKASSRRPASQAEIIDAWLAERCTWGEAAPQGQTLAADLFADYCAWRKLRRGRPVTQTAFGLHLRALGISSFKSNIDGRTRRFPIQINAGELVHGDCLVTAATAGRGPGASWKASEASIIDRWLAERCLCGAEAGKGRTPAADLFADFVAWGRGQSLATVTQTAFGRHLRTRGIMGAKRAEGGRVMRWPIQFRAGAQSGLGGSDLDPHERAKARRLAAMPAADVYSAFRGRAG